MNELKETVIIYHGSNCRDGFGSAYAAWKKFGDTASYLPMNERNTVPEGLIDKEIYILDYSFNKETLVDLANKNKSVMVIDHHISAQEAVTSFSQNIFDNNHSGAVLTWHYFHPDTEVPSLLEHIEDHDIWKFELPNNREFNAALGEHAMDFEIWDNLVKNLEDETFFTHFINTGATIATFEDRLVARIMENKERVVFEGHEVWALNVDKTYRSILGHQLATLNEEVGGTALGIVYARSNGSVKISLRSNGDVDVSKIAQKYGGGGHKNAASIKVDSFADLPFTFIEN